MKRVITTLPTSFLRVGHMTFAGDFARFQKKPVQVKRNLIKIDWDLFLCLLSICLILLELIVYELEFSEDRTHNNCKHNKVEWIKFIVLGLSLIGTTSIFIKYKQGKYKIGFRYLPLFEGVIMFFVTFPYATAHIRYQQSTNMASINGKAITREICYTLSEFLYLVGFAKSYFVYKYLLNKLDSKKSKQKLHRYDIEDEEVSEMNLIYFVVFLGIITIAILAEFLRVSERPFIEISHQNYSSYQNCIWCLICSLTSIGFGDLYPTTHMGRFSVVISSTMGALFLGLTLYFFSKWTTLSKSDTKTMKIIDKNRICGKIIVNCLIYNHFLIKFGKYDEKSINQKIKLLKIISQSNFNFKYRAYRSDKFHKKIFKTMKKLENKLDKFNFAIN